MTTVKQSRYVDDEAPSLAFWAPDWAPDCRAARGPIKCVYDGGCWSDPHQFGHYELGFGPFNRASPLHSRLCMHLRAPLKK